MKFMSVLTEINNGHRFPLWDMNVMVLRNILCIKGSAQYKCRTHAPSISGRTVNGMRLLLSYHAFNTVDQTLGITAQPVN